MIEIIINHEFRLLIIIINSLVGLMGMGLVAGKMSLDILLASEYPMIQRKEDNSVQCVHVCVFLPLICMCMVGLVSSGTNTAK